jgi:hypothetical protein
MNETELRLLVTSAFVGASMGELIIMLAEHTDDPAATGRETYRSINAVMATFLEGLTKARSDERSKEIARDQLARLTHFLGQEMKARRWID